MAKLEFTESERIKFNRICASKNALLSFHENPDPDSIGSNLALAHFLKNYIGTKVTVLWGTTGYVERFNYLLQGFPVLTTPISSINPNDYDRLIIVDTANPLRSGLDPAKILADWGGNVSIIDHHKGNNWNEITPRPNHFVDTILKPEASSTAELLYDLMVHQELKAVTKEVANYLKVGIWGDTRGFAVNADAALFEKFSHLVSIAPEMDLIQRMERPLYLSDIPIFADMLNNIQVQKYGNLNVLMVMIQSEAGNIPTTHLATHFFDQFHEADVICAYTQTSFDSAPFNYRISIRSNEHTANGIARTIAERVGGSGHNNAAGGTVRAKDTAELSEIFTRAFSE